MAAFWMFWGGGGSFCSGFPPLASSRFLLSSNEEYPQPGATSSESSGG